MPQRRRRRPDQAHPIPAARSASPFLTPLALEPISARHRRRLPFRRRWLAATLGGATLALTIPIALGPLAGTSVRLDPLSGGVAGAVSEPRVTPTPTPLPVPATPAPPTLVRATDPDAPPTMADRLPPPIVALTGYRWPLTAGRISLPMKEIPGGEWTRAGARLHDGVDMASFCGAGIVAAHEGVVLAAGRHFDGQLGWIGSLKPYYRLLNQRHAWNTLPIVVVVDDGNGYRSIYAHFRDITVHVGQHVRAGQLIGYEGATGHASGCHLHYGLFSPLETARFGLRSDIRTHMRLPAWEIARIDPLLVLPRGDVALKTRQIAKAISAAARDAARQ
ncbi:MAG TPA: M23 family metallopeptidase [Candidatus Limnocylindrales bacterium]|nr:M23 family metallopeptidase [Candidatus Limnocylindrales bacterium]